MHSFLGRLGYDLGQTDGALNDRVQEALRKVNVDAPWIIAGAEPSNALIADLYALTLPTTFDVASGLS
jgi:hypothetical protein